VNVQFTGDPMNRRDEILQATLTLIPQHGLNGLRISQIAHQADCSPGIIYHYFESKDEIILSLGEIVTAEFGRALNVDHLVTLTPFERLKQGWLNTFHYFVSNPEKTLFLEQYKNSPYQSDESFGADFEKLIVTLNEDIANGRLKNFPIMIMYEMTLTVAISLAKQVVKGHLVVDEELLDKVATACCEALLA
jgi:AcrR family transcriptional regulator